MSYGEVTRQEREFEQLGVVNCVKMTTTFLL